MTGQSWMWWAAAVVVMAAAIAVPVSIVLLFLRALAKPDRDDEQEGRR